MSDLQKYIAERKRTDEDFAKDYEEGFENLKADETFTERAERGDWEKASEVLAKALDVEPEDYDKL